MTRERSKRIIPDDDTELETARMARRRKIDMLSLVRTTEAKMIAWGLCIIAAGYDTAGVEGAFFAASAAVPAALFLKPEASLNIIQGTQQLYQNLPILADFKPKKLINIVQGSQVVGFATSNLPSLTQWYERHFKIRASEAHSPVAAISKLNNTCQ
jgi:hypothetical protein